MAWNEPGGNGKQRDPWGGDQGPPDLDEAFRKFRQKLGAAFGSGSGGGSGEDTALNRAIAGLIVLVLASLWLYAGVNVLDEQQRAVVLRFGRFHEVLEPGFNWNPKWIDQVMPENVTAERQYNSSGPMLTQDENIVELPIAVQYNIADIKAFLLNVNDSENSLRQATDSALRHVVGSSTLDQVLSEGRGKIGDDVRSKLQGYMDNYGTGIQVVKVTIQGARPPAEVKAAFDDVIKAKEDEERLKNEASAYAFSVVPEARGRAQRVFEEAAAYRGKVVAEAQGEAQRFEKLLGQYEKAPEVTRERLYLDAVQRVMSNSSKVLIDVPGGNNVMYLPIDRLGRPPEPTPPAVRSPQVDDADNAARDALDRARSNPGNLRQRERR